MEEYDVVEMIDEIEKFGISCLDDCQVDMFNDLLFEFYSFGYLNNDQIDILVGFYNECFQD